MKKLFVLFLVFVMLIPALSACSADQLDTSDDMSYEEYVGAHQTETVVGEYASASEEEEYPIYQDDCAEIATIIPAFDSYPGGDIALEYLFFINDNLYERTPFSYRERETADWLVETLLDMGYTEADIKLQEFSREYMSRLLDGCTPGLGYYMLLSNLYHISGNDEVRDYSQNVILTVPGESDRVIVVGAHYDSYAFPGAADNASGMALLLESAMRMRYLDNYHTIVYVFFGAEEVGLLGANYFIDTLSRDERENILFMVNVDLLFEGPHLLYVAGVKIPGIQQGGLIGENHITQAWDNIATELNALYDDIELISYPQGLGRFFSDHWPFYRIEIPVVMFSGMYQQNDGTFGDRPFIFYWAYREDGQIYVRRTDIEHEESFALYSGLRHSRNDCIHIINYNWPGKVERAMWGYAIFLEAILLQQYY